MALNFKQSDGFKWKAKIMSPKFTKIWGLAFDISNKYHGKEGRYYNETIVKDVFLISLAFLKLAVFWD
ncbi:hypothetical protein [Algoriphagus halophilus]|uniref:Uncharacterized protein n=1 Tax=Algoriphagus halophilus TaxID=226505 RepID=A0A1N6G3S4_9BACT|nr:hypothetical protein [Algoriphagus halophilus]SIO02174.1 hypothetical protein SAMN05444394_2945 [Algoriphagus halophilus]